MSHAPVTPGEILSAANDVMRHAGKGTTTVMVANIGDRPVQVGAHYHFAETNQTLDFDRAAARGMRLAIAAGTSLRFEPGQLREVALIPIRAAGRIFGQEARVMGAR